MVFDERNARRRAVCLLVTVATSLVPLARAYAEPAPVPSDAAPSAEQRADAQRLREQGQAHFDAGRYAQAAAAFARAFELTRATRDLFNQGTALHWAGDCGAAREAFEAYLAREDDQPLERAERRTEARTALDYLRGQCPTAGPDVTRGSGAAPATATGPAEEVGAGVPLAPSPSLVAVPTSPAVQNTSAPPPGSVLPPSSILQGANAEAVYGPGASATAGTGPEPDHGASLPDVLRWSALGTGAALAVAAVATGFAGHAAATDLEDLNRAAAAHDARWDDCCLERAHELNGERRSYQAATVALGIASGMLLGTAAVLWTLDLDTEGESRAGLGSATLTYRSRF
jgi:tetratricopeptide (TPR) repeat protein